MSNKGFVNQFKNTRRQVRTQGKKFPQPVFNPKTRKFQESPPKKKDKPA